MRLPDNVIFISLFIFHFLAVCQSSADVTEWPDIRDGRLFLKTEKPVNITVKWRQFFANEAIEQFVYLIGPSGILIERLHIQKQDTTGLHIFKLPTKGDYYLEICGLSFRAFTVSIPEKIKNVFQPVRHHFSIMTRPSSYFYFKVPAKRQFTFCGKFQGGIESLLVISPKNDSSTLNLSKQPEILLKDYYENDKMLIANTDHESFFKVVPCGWGKAAFWLENIENLFCIDTNEWFLPLYKTGDIQITIDSNIIGSTPSIGAHIPEIIIPQFGYSIIDSLKVNSGLLYAKKREINNGKYSMICDIYGKNTQLKSFVTLLCVFNEQWIPQGKQLQTLDLFPSIKRMFNNQQIEGYIHYVSIFDEPNFIMDDKSQFKSFFNQFNKDRINNNLKVKVLAPESSGFINGPPSSSSKGNIGSTWITDILKDDWDCIHGISWHEWNIRNLISTEWYAYSIDKAYQIVNSLKPSGKEPKKIFITQTNISSGFEYSPYELYTFYNALWWSSVVIQSANTGKIAMINYFSAFDNNPQKKALVAYNAGKATLRPAAFAMTFVNKAILGKTLSVREQSPEVDILGTTDSSGDSISLLMVSKTRRNQNLLISLVLKDSQIKKKMSFECLSIDSNLAECKFDKITLTNSKRGKSFSLLMNGESLYRLHIHFGDTSGTSSHSPSGKRNE